MTMILFIDLTLGISLIVMAVYWSILTYHAVSDSLKKVDFLLAALLFLVGLTKLLALAQLSLLIHFIYGIEIILVSQILYVAYRSMQKLKEQAERVDTGKSV